VEACLLSPRKIGAQIAHPDCREDPGCVTESSDRILTTRQTLIFRSAPLASVWLPLRFTIPAQPGDRIPLRGHLFHPLQRALLSREQLPLSPCGCRDCSSLFLI